MRWHRKIVAVGIALSTLAPAMTAHGFTYYPAVPSGPLGFRYPTIQQQFILDAGETLDKVEMWLDGQPVKPSIDQAVVHYTPSAPLEPGTHKARLLIQVTHPKAAQGWQYKPIETQTAFTVETDAVIKLPAISQPAMAALHRINSIRQTAGLAPFVYNPSLGAAAERHALYMDVNRLYEHAEVPGNKQFSGINPWDRAGHYGYTGGGIAEDIHMVSDPVKAVDDWIAAPYHRFPILSPAIAEMGFGSAGPFSALDMGRGSDIDQIAVWPAPEQREVPISWNGIEMPSPLRLYPGTAGTTVGSAISLQSGRSAESLILDSAVLTAPDGTTVPVMQFSPRNDDHLRSEAFLIPYKPMLKGATYTVTMAGSLSVQGKNQAFSKTWSFTTEGTLALPALPVGSVPPTTPELPRGPVPPTTPALAQLIDVGGHWAENEIAALTTAGVVNGNPDRTFRPDDSLTRSQFVKMLVASLDTPLVPGDAGGYADTTGHWLVSQGYLKAAVDAGIILAGDYPAGRFQPDREITRDEIAVMVVRAGKWKIPDTVPLTPTGDAIIGSQKFADASSWPHMNHVGAAVQNGIVTGYALPNGLYAFRPASLATRAEACVMVNRLRKAISK